MGLIDRARNRFIDLAGGIRKEELEQLRGELNKEMDRRVSEAIDWASVGEDEPTYYGYRGYGQALRDLLEGRHKMALEAAWEMYVSNPLAQRLLQMKRDFVVGEGITFEAEDERVQEVLASFWGDPVNRLDRWIYQMALELGLWGEQIYPVFVRTGEDVGGAGDGRVRCGVVDPLRVRKVMTDPNNARVKTEVHVVGPGNRTLKYGIVRVADEGLNKGRLIVPSGYDQGCFYFNVNGLSNSTRGIPDLLAQSDWLTQYEKYLFNVLEREQLIKYFVWKAKVTGATEAQLRAKAKERKAPKPGSILWTNENEDWEPVSPDLNQVGSEVAGRQVLTHIVGTAGFPEHWFGRGESATRATAKEMGEPTIKSLTSRQRYFGEMLHDMLDFVIDQAIIARTLPENVNQTYILKMPDISVRDTGTATMALLQVCQALVLATQQGWVTQEKAIEIFAQVAVQLGVKVEAEEAQPTQAQPTQAKDEDYGGDGQGNLKEALKLMGEKPSLKEWGLD